MMWSYPPGATPLDPDEVEGLIPLNVTTQKELNEIEQNNILKAQIYYMTKKYSSEKILSSNFIEKVHQKMFDDTWRWAGSFRKSNKNIGVDWYLIPTALKPFLEDVIYQINHGSYQVDEIAARFHHRLVFIHPFPNGNGRHARLMTDILLKSMNHPVFTWGSNQLTEKSVVRENYISALRAADRGNVNVLMEFART